MNVPLLQPDQSATNTQHQENILNNYIQSNKQSSIKNLFKSFTHHESSQNTGAHQTANNSAAPGTENQAANSPNPYSFRAAQHAQASVSAPQPSTTSENSAKPMTVNDTPQLNQNNNPQIIQASNPVQRVAIEGHLATCGKCQSRILFPLGVSQVSCGFCGSINAFNYSAMQPVCQKAFMTCPVCKGNILYTIGASHFQCTCGALIVIPTPLYYIPFFGVQNTQPSNGNGSVPQLQHQPQQPQQQPQLHQQLPQPQPQQPQPQQQPQLQPQLHQQPQLQQPQLQSQLHQQLQSPQLHPQTAPVIPNPSTTSSLFTSLNQSQGTSLVSSPSPKPQPLFPEVIPPPLSAQNSTKSTTVPSITTTEEHKDIDIDKELDDMLFTKSQSPRFPSCPATTTTPTVPLSSPTAPLQMPSVPVTSIDSDSEYEVIEEIIEDVTPSPVAN